MCSPFDGRLSLLQVRDCKNVAHGESMSLNFVGERVQKCGRENDDSGVRSK